MATLEYCLDEPESDFPALYHYPDIPKDELAVRLTCDYFTKDGTVYAQSFSCLADNIHQIYVKPTGAEKPTHNPRSTSGMGFIVLEIRIDRGDAQDYPLMDYREFGAILDLLLFTYVDYLTLNGVEWERSALEIDEDRKVYQLYIRQPDESNELANQ